MPYISFMQQGGYNISSMVNVPKAVLINLQNKLKGSGHPNTHKLQANFK